MGRKASKTRKSWESAYGRCHRPSDPSYAKYGALGISMCLEWRESFLAFLEHMGTRPEGTTLDRIDNSRGYEPGNCRWATPIQQSRNRRSTKFVVWRERLVGFMDACDEVGLPAGTVRARLRKGFSVDEALSLPLFKGGTRNEWRAGN